MKTTVVLSILAFLSLSAPTAFGQAKKDKNAKAVTITAEDLTKECMADKEKASAKYAGKTLQVRGKVGDIYDDILYLPTKVKGEEVTVGIRFDKNRKPAVKKGERATFEGKFDLIAVLGPTLIDGKLISKE
jgi:hypothetical protein